MAADKFEEPEGRRTMGQKIKAFILNNLLVILIVLSMIIGVALGLGLRSDPGWKPTEKRKIFFLRFPGDLFMNMLKCLILPLIISSIITGIGHLDVKAAGRMGVRAIVYYLTTTLISVILGIILVLAIQPGYKGKSREEIERSGKAKNTGPLYALFDLIRSVFPPNLVQACFEKQTTTVSYVKVEITTAAPMMTTAALNVSNITTTLGSTTEAVIQYMEIETPRLTTAGGSNVLGIIAFCIFFGVIIASMEEAGKPLLNFFDSLFTATMTLIQLVLWYTPIGILFLVAAKLVEMEDASNIFQQIGFYVITVLVGLAIHGLIILPLLYFIIVRRNPYKFLYNMLKALLTAWGTASSSATLSITMNCLEFKNNVDLRVVKLIAPIGATVNMDGTALYEAVAAIFIAQVNNINLDFGQVVTVSLTATAAAIGAAGIPSAGLVTMAVVLTAVDLPVEDITLILAIDWFLDRFRTAVNVLGDSYGAGIVEKLSKADLAVMDEAQVVTDELDVVAQVKPSGNQMQTFEKKGVSNPVFVDSNPTKL